MKNHKISRHRLHPDNMFPPHPDIIGECDNCHKYKSLYWYGNFGYLCLGCMKSTMAEEEIKKGNSEVGCLPIPLCDICGARLVRIEIGDMLKHECPNTVSHMITGRKKREDKKMKVAKITLWNNSVFYTSKPDDTVIYGFSKRAKDKFGQRPGQIDQIDIIEMSEADYNKIAATNESAELFGQ